MVPLYLVGILTTLFVLSAVLPLRWASCLTSHPAAFENWISKSWLRIFGLPLLPGVAINGLGYLTGTGESVKTDFSTAFVACMFFIAILALGQVKRVRLALKIIFMTVFFGTVMAMLTP
jgi:hypothetical protein